jgi:hypothetical protein
LPGRSEDDTVPFTVFSWDDIRFIETDRPDSFVAFFADVHVV